MRGLRAFGPPARLRSFVPRCVRVFARRYCVSSSVGDPAVGFGEVLLGAAVQNVRFREKSPAERLATSLARSSGYLVRRSPSPPPARSEFSSFWCTLGPHPAAVRRGGGMAAWWGCLPRCAQAVGLVPACCWVFHSSCPLLSRPNDRVPVCVVCAGVHQNVTPVAPTADAGRRASMAVRRTPTVTVKPHRHSKYCNRVREVRLG